MLLLGNLVQVFHLTLGFVILFFVIAKFGRPIGAIIAMSWTLIAVIANMMTGGNCPITMLSNKFLAMGGGAPYRDLYHWMCAVSGSTVGGTTMLIGSIILPITCGLVPHWKKWNSKRNRGIAYFFVEHKNPNP